MSFASGNVRFSLKPIIFAVLFAAAGLLLAFGPRQNSAAPQDRVIVDYWEHWTGAEAAAMRQIVDDFNSTVGKEKKIFVRFLSASGVQQKTLIATAAGVPPDIAGVYNQDVPQFASLNALEPLDDLAATHDITPQRYKKVFWDECHYNGRLYALVSTAFDIGLYYNLDLFHDRADLLRARGLDPERAPRTIAELDAYADALNQVDAGGRLTVAGYLPLEPGWYQNYTCLWFGGRWWDDANHRFTFTDAGVVRAYDWIQSYSRRLGAGSETEFRMSMGAFDSPQNAFLAGRVAMEMQGSFLASFIQKQKPSMAGHWAAAPFPALDPAVNDVTYCNCDVLVIPRRAAHKVEAFEFINFVNRQDEMEKLASLHCKLSALANVSESFLARHPNPFIRMFDRLAASPHAYATEQVPTLNEVTDEMNNFVQRLSTLQTTPAEGLRQMQDRLQARYDDFSQEQRQRADAGEKPLAHSQLP